MSNLMLFALICAGVLAVNEIAEPSDAHEIQHVIPFQVSSVYDGDTITGIARLWPNLLHRTSVRLRGIDTPELRNGCEDSKALAVIARSLTDSLVKAAHVVALSEPGLDKYGGRVVADVLVDGRNLSTLLIERGVAKPYSGKGSRPDWCGREGEI